MEEEEKSKSLAKLKNKHEAMITDLEGETRWARAFCAPRLPSCAQLIGPVLGHSLKARPSGFRDSICFSWEPGLQTHHCMAGWLSV